MIRFVLNPYEKKTEILQEDVDAIAKMVFENEKNPVRPDLRNMLKAYVDRIPGGKGDSSDPMDLDFEQLEKGVAVEMEHTQDPLMALEIAIDHLTEDPAYYTKLERVHAEGGSDEN